MKKKHKQLIKKILNEEIGSVQQHGTHQWTVEHPNDAFAKLSSEQKNYVRQLASSGRLHPEFGHPLGWKPGTGPLFGRDFHGRSADDYKKLAKVVYTNLRKNLGRSHEQAAEDTTAHIQQLKISAAAEGHYYHTAHMRVHNEIRAENEKLQREKQRVETNTSNLRAADRIKQQTEESTNLFHAAIGAAGRAHDHFSSTTDDSYKLSPEAAKHLSSITKMARQTMHDTVIGGLGKVSGEFVNHAQQQFKTRFSGVKPSDFGYSSPHHIVPSLIQPDRVREMIKNYSNNKMHPHDHFVEWDKNAGGFEQKQMHEISSHIGVLSDVHPFAKHLHLGPSHIDHSGGQHTHYYEDIIGHGMKHFRSVLGSLTHHASDFKNYFVGQIFSRREHGTDFAKEHGFDRSGINAEQRKNTIDAVTSGKKNAAVHIMSIPNLSDDDRRNLMKHFEVQMRHHYVAAMANPRMYAEYHGGKVKQEAEAETRQREQARERARQRASAGGSGEAPPPRRSRWQHKEQPHEILGIARNASPAEIKRAFRKLSLQHHPDRGGSVEMFKKINDAHEVMSGKLNEMVMMLAEWITKRHRK